MRRRLLFIGAVVLLAVSGTLRADIISFSGYTSASSPVTHDMTNPPGTFNAGQSLQIAGDSDDALPTINGDLNSSHALVSQQLPGASQQPTSLMFRAADSMLQTQTLNFDFDYTPISSLNSVRWHSQVPEPATITLLGLCSLTLFGSRSKKM